MNGTLLSNAFIGISSLVSIACIDSVLFSEGRYKGLIKTLKNNPADANLFTKILLTKASKPETIFETTIPSHFTSQAIISCYMLKDKASFPSLPRVLEAVSGIFAWGSNPSKFNLLKMALACSPLALEALSRIIPEHRTTTLWSLKLGDDLGSVATTGFLTAHLISQVRFQNSASENAVLALSLIALVAHCFTHLVRIGPYTSQQDASYFETKKWEDLLTTHKNEIQSEFFEPKNENIQPLKNIPVFREFGCFENLLSDLFPQIPSYRAFSSLQELSEEDFNKKVMPQTVMRYGYDTLAFEGKKERSILLVKASLSWPSWTVIEDDKEKTFDLDDTDELKKEIGSERFSATLST